MLQVCSGVVYGRATHTTQNARPRDYYCPSTKRLARRVYYTPVSPERLSSQLGDQ